MEKSSCSILFENISAAVASACKELGYGQTSPSGTIDFSKGFGDVSCSVSFGIAKEHGKNADEVAKGIAAKLAKPQYVESISVKNGFINFNLDRDTFAKLTLETAQSEAKAEKGKERVIIEYPSVNPNKPWHVGHLRNALLGDSIARMHSRIGFNVEREDYIDDLGLQMAETIWWYLSEKSKPNKKFDHWLGEEYVKANEHLSDSTKPEISKIMSLMGQDGTYESKLLRDIVTECIKAQYETAFNYSVFHDLLVWESDIVREKFLEKALKLLEDRKVTERPKDGDYANCTIINLKGVKDLPDELKGLKADAKVLVRSNGIATYVAKDIAFHMWKFGMLEDTFRYAAFMQKQPNGEALYTTSQEGKRMDFSRASLVINIIDVRQSHPQSIVKASFKAMGKNEHAESIMHLAYGRVELEGVTLSGRKGTWQGYSADDLLREAEEKAKGLMTAKFKFAKDEEMEIVHGVALAAIKFEFLKTSPEKNIIFSWGRALTFEGNSGPYAQYMHARASRILEEAPRDMLNRKAENPPKISDAEFLLVKLISRKMNMIEKAARELRPNVMTDYISELGYAFASFYESSPVLKAESDDEKAFRISLTAAFKNTMKDALSMLGIDALERM